MSHDGLRRGAHRSIILVVAAMAMLVVSALTARPVHAAVTIQEVVSPGGVKAWLVEDYSVPLVTIRFAFKGGSTQDPAGREGLANLMTGLFDEGAGDLDADAFQIALDDAGAEMSFNATRDAIYGSMRTLAETRGEAFALLKLAVGAPRFDAEPLARIRAQIVSGIEARSRNPNTVAEIAWAEAIYGDHPYARRDEGTADSLASVTADDLRAFHAANFARSNLFVGVVGAIDAQTLARELDALFAELPAEARLADVERLEPRLAQEVRVPFDLPQTRLRLAYPGLERKDPRFFAAYLMNHVLGGGTFTSRLFREVREARGLAYGISSSLVNRDYVSSLVIGTSTRSDRIDETLSVIREEIARMAAEGPSEDELAAAKRFVIGAYAINNLDNSGAIANTLVTLQVEDLGIDYIERRRALIEAVTIDEVREAARLLLSQEPAIMTVGPERQPGQGG